MSDLTKPEHVPSCVSTGEGVTVPTPAPTPRTDASLKSRNHLPNWFDDVVAADFARTLERELTSAQAALAAKDREIENLVWNLAGCDTLAIGYAKPGEFSKELARPALHSVSKLRAEVEHIKAWANAKADEAQDLRATLLAREGELDELQRQLAEAGKDKERIDWLENQGHLIARQYRDGWHFDASNGAWVCVNATTLRAAIDSAREAQP